MDVVYKRAELANRLQTKIDGLRNAAAIYKKESDEYHRKAREILKLPDDARYYRWDHQAKTANYLSEVASEMLSKVPFLEEVLAHLPETDLVTLTLDDVRRLQL